MDNPDIAWVFKEIKGHQGPLRKTHLEYKRSAYNVLVQWEDVSETYKPLDIIIKDDPVLLQVMQLKITSLTHLDGDLRLHINYS